MNDGKAETVDEFLATLSDGYRAALESVRRTILNAEPSLEECISYGVPSYRYQGKLLISFGAAAKHLAIYPGPQPIDALKDKLTGFSTSKGAVRFTPEKPLPDELIRDLVAAGIAKGGVR